jgi:MerR family transcriptional regulator, repressor of the yfmOP operon
MTPAQSPSRPLRIGELAERAGTTPRTIRYYEEIGLLGTAEDRGHGRHRSYDEDDVARLEHILRLRDLLGLSLEDLQRVVEAEDARAALRREWHGTDDRATRRRIVDQALGHIAVQLELVERRQAALDELAAELHERRARLERRRGELTEG